VDDQLIIDSLTDVTDGFPRRNYTLTALTLTLGEYYPIRVRYYQASGNAGIRLAWQQSGSGANFTTIETQYLYHKMNDTAITAKTEILTAQYLPQMPTSLYQSDYTTYEGNALTIHWTAPVDTGCIAITSYTIQGSQDNTTWADLTTGITTNVGRAMDDGSNVLIPGQAGSLRVVPYNALGQGEPSDPIQLVPAALPTPPAVIRVTYHREGYLTLDWDVPVDTGGGDSVAVDPSTIVYRLEVDEGFHESSSLDNFVPLTGYDPERRTIDNALVYVHYNLVPGHVYSYRIKAENLMGYGLYSSTFSFIPRVPPGQPPLAPRNRPTVTTRTMLAFEYDAVLDEGGDTISHYSVHIDDGTDSDNFANFTAGTALQFDTSALTTAGSLTLVTGRMYRIKYQAINVAGEGPLSPECQILLAEAPSAPSNIRRINIDTLPAG
jgi:hypothetical protein